jgi:hypothetical protein
LPYAHRLVREGASVEVVVWAHEFERAWEGQLQKALRGSRGELTRERLAKLARGRVVLSDIPNVRSELPGELQLFDTLSADEKPTSRLRLGGWFDGEQWSLRHLVVVDLGAWQGGLGPVVPGAATLVRADRPETLELFDSLASGVRDVLKSQSFRGLVSMGLRLDAPEGPAVEGFEAGWPALSTQAFVGELEGFGELLNGHGGRLVSKYVVVVPVTVPPWPSPGTAAVRPIDGLTREQLGRVAWHDMAVDPTARTLATAGLDGLVGVARGAAESLPLATGRALEIALRVRVAEKQFRPDAGGTVATELAVLENNWGVVL